MFQCIYYIGRKKKHAIDADELRLLVTACGPPPSPASAEYWKCITKKLLGTTSPRLMKAVSTYWYCNREGVRAACTKEVCYYAVLRVVLIQNIILLNGINVLSTMSLIVCARQTKTCDWLHAGCVQKINMNTIPHSHLSSIFFLLDHFFQPVVMFIVHSNKEVNCIIIIHASAQDS